MPLGRALRLALQCMASRTWHLDESAFLSHCAGGYIRIYALEEGGRSLRLLHKTRVDGVPGALASFKGRLLAGIETTVRLYDLGKKKLLRKCEHRKCVPR